MNFFFELILILLAILAMNVILYSLTFFNKPNSSENISVKTNSSEKDGLALTASIASNPINLTSSEANGSQSLSVTSSEANGSQSLSVTSSETNGSEDILDFQNRIEVQNRIDSIINEKHLTSSETNGSQDTLERINLTISEETYTSLDSLTILNSQSYEQWRELALELHQHPTNSPAGVIQQIKFEELNILYSQDLIHYAITQTELRLIIEHLPAISLFNSDINHLILTIMSYYHL
jgi:hypothetical protein